jgi:antibiotic biosynthesis monooxygenase (ABM) superfamily enzyme
MSVVLVNLFEVRPGDEGQFLDFHRRINAYMQGKPGFVGNRLHRSLGPDAGHRFINVVEEESAKARDNGRDEGFRAIVGPPDRLPFTSTPALYEVVDVQVPQAADA